MADRGHDAWVSDQSALRPEIGAYPLHWEADVVLADGRPVHLRPVRPQDGPALAELHQRLSAQSVYFRFFAPKPRLSEEEVFRFTHVDYADRVALVAVSGSELIGIGGYDRINEQQAEVAFIVRDDLQGRGLGSVFLEHLAAAAREHGISRFTAEVLPSNGRMLATFREAGYVLSQHLEQDVISVAFDIEPTVQSRAVIASREHRAEARSLSRLLNPGSIAVVGASRRPGSVGHALLQHLVGSGFSGSVIAVHPHAEQILTVRCVPHLRQAPAPVDLAVVAVPAHAVDEVLEDAAAAGVIGLVVVSGGFADSGAAGIVHQRSLVDQARLLGVRIVGPNALGLVNTDPQIKMNASLVSQMPAHGRVGFFCQSGALGSSILRRLQSRGLGISTFVSAGNRADVSGNDLLQYWQDDEDTGIVLLYLESMGNARKFARLVRRIAPIKPVLMVGSPGAEVPSGHLSRSSELSRSAVAGLLEACGLVTLAGVDRMLDLATVLACQPMPTGAGLGIVGNSDALAVLAANAAGRHSCQVPNRPATFPRDASAERYRLEVRQALARPEVGVALVIHVPPVEGMDDEGILQTLAEIGLDAGKPIVAVMQGTGPTTAIRESIPVFEDVEDALAAIGSMMSLAAWRRELAREPAPPAEVESDTLVAIVRSAVGDQPTTLDGEAAVTLLAMTGLAVTLGREKVTSGCRIALQTDALYGPVVSVSLDDPAAIALGDVSVRLAPLHRDQADEAVAALKSLPVVMNWADGKSGQTASITQACGRLADAMHRVSWLPAWAPQVCQVQINGLTWTDGWQAASVSISLDPHPEAFDPDARRMGG